MRAARLPLIFLALSAICGVVFLIVVTKTAGPRLATGATVTPSGQTALVSSLLSFLATTVAAVVSAFLQRGSGSSVKIIDGLDSDELAELTSSLADVVIDTSNRAKRRRFVFALTDCVDVFPGMEASHEGGVVILKYSLFADED